MDYDIQILNNQIQEMKKKIQANSYYIWSNYNMLPDIKDKSLYGFQISLIKMYKKQIKHCLKMIPITEKRINNMKIAEKNKLINEYIEKNYKDLFKDHYEYKKEWNAYISTDNIYLYVQNNTVYENVQDMNIYNDYIEFKTNNYKKALKLFKDFLKETNEYKEDQE